MSHKYFSLIFTILLLSNDVICFIRHDPIVWQPSPRKLLKRFEIIRFNITLDNPCESYLEIMNNTDIQEELKAQLNELHNSCSQTYQEEVIENLDKLLTNNETQLNTHRIKRAVPYTLLAGSAKFLIPAAMANPVTAVIAVVAVVAIIGIGWLVWKLSPSDAVKEDVSNHHSLLTKVQEDMRKIESKFNNHTRQFTIFSMILPRIINANSKYMARMHVMGSQLRLARSFHNNEQKSEYIINALNLTLPCNNCPLDSLKLLNFEKLNKLNYLLIVGVILVDTTCVVMKADPFEIFSKNSTHICKKIYVGLQYLMHNLSQTGKCPLYSVEEPTNSHVYYDFKPTCGKKIESWKLQSCRKIEDGWEKQPQVIKTPYEMVIYCPGHNITIMNDKATDCPDFAFKIPLTVSFKVGSFNWESNDLAQAVSPNLQLFRDSINQNLIIPDDRFKLELESTNFELVLHSAKGYLINHYTFGIFQVVIASILCFLLYNFYLKRKEMISSRRRTDFERTRMHRIIRRSRITLNSSDYSACQ